MTRFYTYFMPVCISCLFFHTAQATNITTSLADRSAKPLTLEDTVTFPLQDKKTGQPYQIFLSVPKEQPPAGGYPILYITDANNIFNTVRETMRAYEKRPDHVQKDPAILVGIGYPSEPMILKARTYDLTPPKNTAIPIPYPTGGAENFHHFIQNRLKPLLNQHFPINSQKQALFGHSFGGLFTIYTLIHHPDAYQTYVAASPSLWLDPDLINRNRKQFAARLKTLKQAPTLLISVGEYEQKIPPYWNGLPQADHMKHALVMKQQVSRIHAACQVLAALPHLMTDCIDFPDEDHQSVIPASIGRAIPVIFRSFSDPLSPKENKGKDPIKNQGKIQFPKPFP